ncbi:MAG: DUF2752 domain-containing protein [Chitinophagaceae bacterium]|jgi:hypothetical protein|nr:DUF2752 domain-containing protein [Chitinophagaceae bacterium]
MRLLNLLNAYKQSFIWLTALVLLFRLDDGKDSISFCIPSMLGFSYCPGCGIGHAIHHALHLNFTDSFRAHWLGIPAAIAILYLIIQPFFLHPKIKSYEPPIYDDDHS